MAVDLIGNIEIFRTAKPVKIYSKILLCEAHAVPCFLASDRIFPFKCWWNVKPSPESWRSTSWHPNIPCVQCARCHHPVCVWGLNATPRHASPQLYIVCGVDISGLAVIIFNQNGINIPYRRTSAREQPHQHCCPTIHTSQHSIPGNSSRSSPQIKLTIICRDVNEHSQSFTVPVLLKVPTTVLQYYSSIIPLIIDIFKIQTIP